MGENREKIVLVISRNKRKLPHWYIIQNYWSWFWKNNASLNFPTTRMLVQIFHEFCRILNWFCLLCQMLRHKNIKYAKFSCSNLQLPAYNAYRSQQKITDLVVRQLTRSDFVEFCGSKYSDDVIPPRKCHDLE